MTDTYGTVGGGLDSMASGNSTNAVNLPEAGCEPAADLFANGFEGNRGQRRRDDRRDHPGRGALP